MNPAEIAYDHSSDRTHCLVLDTISDGGESQMVAPRDSQLSRSIRRAVIIPHVMRIGVFPHVHGSRQLSLDRFSASRANLDGDDIVEVSVQDTYVDAGVGVAQIAWPTPDENDQWQTGLVQVSIDEGSRLNKQMHRSRFVRGRDIEPADTRFD